MIGDIYQAYCHTYKTHAMATHHGGSGQYSDRYITAHETTDTAIEHVQEFYHVNTNDFEESEPNNPVRLTTITRDWMIYTSESKLEKDNPQKL